MMSLISENEYLPINILIINIFIINILIIILIVKILFINILIISIPIIIPLNFTAFHKDFENFFCLHNAGQHTHYLPIQSRQSLF